LYHRTKKTKTKTKDKTKQNKTKRLKNIQNKAKIKHIMFYEHTSGHVDQ